MTELTIDMKRVVRSDHFDRGQCRVFFLEILIDILILSFFPLSTAMFVLSGFFSPPGGWGEGGVEGSNGGIG